MLKQLARLSVEADGRYATAEELQFLKDYLDSADQRLSAYEKIREIEEKLIEQVKAKMLSLDSNLFRKGSQDFTAEELRCLKDYLHSVDQGSSADEKMSQSEAKFIEQLKAEMQSLDSKAFRNGAQNVISIWKRDVKHTLRSSAAAMLINDLDRLREGFLLWHRTIVHVFQVEDIAQLTYQVMPEVIQQYLTPEEATLIMSALQLDQTLLS